MYVYYTNAEGVHDPIVTDENFDFTSKGFSKTYPYSNKYLLPTSVYVKLTKINKLLPKDPRRGSLAIINLKASVEIIHEGKVVHSSIHEKPFMVSYVISRKERYRYIGFPDIPVSYLAKFQDDIKIRITIVETDPMLEGCEGTLIIKPNTSH
jgi:hypothetical protein